MTYWQALTVILVPFVPLFLPGIVFLRPERFANVLSMGTRLFLISMLFHILFASIALFLGWSMQLVFWIILGLTAAVAWYRRHTFFSINYAWKLLAILLPIVLAGGLYSTVFLLKQDGLPTGDVQKAVFWAINSLAHGTWPEYSIAPAQLNRDPVDFFTPALHALTAYLLSLSWAPLTSIGIFSILAAVTVAWIAATLTKELFDDHPHIIPPLLAAFFVLTNFRFLRYLREPGYHFQNIVGEFFLLAMLFLGLQLIREWRWSTALLATAAGVTLFFSHQFSAFIGAFMAIPLIITLLLRYRHTLYTFSIRHAFATVSVITIIIVLAALGVVLDLHEKIPHLFSTNPHLTALVPPLRSYPHTLGIVWFLMGLGGAVLMGLQAKAYQAHYQRVWAFLGSLVILLLLSQGPRLFFDIPPVRALFYSIVSLSVCAAYLLGKLWQRLPAYPSPLRWVLGAAVLGMLVVIPGVFVTQRAYATSVPTIRTNSTLTAEQLALVDVITKRAASPEEAIVIDDYNRRSTSWLLLSGQPTYARIAADLERQMEEASQSPERYSLYLNQLEYEKIFNVGSREEMAFLLDKYHIRWLTGIDGSSESSLRYNPVLVPVGYADGATLFERTTNYNSDRTCEDTSLCAWLLRTSTLVNDIGDREDTFEHLPASIRTTRLGEPLYDGQHTFRLTTAPHIPLVFNVGDFTRILWDQEKTGRPDTDLEFLIEFAITPPALALQTPAGTAYPITPDGELVRLSATEVAFNEKGFVTLVLQNPSQQPVAIDLIALGLARVP